MSGNYFYRNRSQKTSTLYFKTWLRQIYFPSAELLANVSLNAAIEKYTNDLKEGIKKCEKTDDKAILNNVLKGFNKTKEVIIDWY